jgi:hypothetical protein
MTSLVLICLLLELELVLVTRFGALRSQSASTCHGSDLLLIGHSSIAIRELEIIIHLVQVLLEELLPLPIFRSFLKDVMLSDR